MGRLTTVDLRPTVEAILRRVPTGKGPGRKFVTAYQILARFPKRLRERLIAERERPGRGAGVYFAAATLVAKTALSLPDIDWHYMDPRGVQFLLAGGKPLKASGVVCGLFRIP